jgi:RND superfamily putative drug exporter
VRTPGDMSGAGRVTRAYARTVVRWRFVIVLGWVVIVIVTMQLPTVRETAPNFEGFVPSDSPTARTEAKSVELFGFPLTSRTVLVQREEDGLSPYSQARVVLRAAALTQQLYAKARWWEVSRSRTPWDSFLPPRRRVRPR